MSIYFSFMEEIDKQNHESKSKVEIESSKSGDSENSDDYYDKYLLFQDYFFAVDDVNSLFWSRNVLSLKIEDYFLGLDVTGNLANAVGYAWYSCS